AFLVEGGKGGGTPIADDKGVARYDQKFGGEMAERALEARRVSKRTVTFDTNALDIAPGVILSIDNHPHGELSVSKQLLVTEVQLRGAVGSEWAQSCHAVFAEVPYRPLL